MTSFDPLHPKTGAIIELLAEHHTLTTRELLRLLDAEHGLKLSTANFYKILGKLVDNQMLVKTGDTVTFNLVWATYVKQCAEKMIQQSADQAFPPLADGERRTYHAESIEKIDPIWTHSILHFFSQESDENIYVYESHPWFILGRPETERRMYESCEAKGKCVNILYGNASFLDQYGYALHKTTPCEARITDEPPFPKEAYNLWLCGDYCIEIFFPELIAQYFANFFASTTAIEEFDLATFSSVFHIKVPVELCISRDAKKAKALKKQFSTFFQ